MGIRVHRKNHFAFIASLALCASISIQAASANVRTDDSDLSPNVFQSWLQAPSLDLTPDQIQSVPAAETALRVLREDHGVATPVAGLSFEIVAGARKLQAVTDADGVAHFGAQNFCTAAQTQITARATLSQAQFSVTQSGSTPYRLAANLPCSGQTTLLFKSDSNGGQALGIWQVATRAHQKLAQSIGLGFWTRPITFIWPADGDYYNYSQVHITRGDYWDVVGHEMGHAIYDLGQLGQFGGGPHKIDECYSEALALSEGWASYFSGWVSVDLNDPDAKFEYMVPRRAPIRFENIPADVCVGETNEWRVTGFFWDFIDLNVDGETSQEPFARLWNALKGSRVRSASAAAARIRAAGLDPAMVNLIWELNFKTKSNLY